MAKKRIGILVAGCVAVGLVGFGVGGFAGALGHGFGGPGMHLALAGLVDDLELDDGQQQRLDAVHNILADHFKGATEKRKAHHAEMIDNIEQGNVDAAEVRQNIDAHLEQARTLAYQVADELVPLVNSLDESQRATLLEFIEKAHGAMGNHGFGAAYAPVTDETSGQ